MRSSFPGTLSVRVSFLTQRVGRCSFEIQPFRSAAVSACNYLTLVLIAVFPFSGPGCWRSGVHCPRFDCQENRLNAAASGCLPSAAREMRVHSPKHRMPLLPCGQRLSLSLPSRCFFHTWQIMHIVISFFFSSLLEDYEGAIVFLTGIFGTREHFSDTYSDMCKLHV